MRVKIRGNGNEHEIFLWLDEARQTEITFHFLTTHANAAEFSIIGENAVAMNERGLARWRVILSRQQALTDYVRQLAKEYGGDAVREAYEASGKIDELPLDYRPAYALSFLKSYFSQRGKIKIEREGL